MRMLGLDRFVSPRRVASASLGDEGEADPEVEFFKNLWEQGRLLPPTDSPYSKRARWRYFLLFLCAYEQIYIPLQMAFKLPAPDVGDEYQLPAIQYVLQWLIDLCFWADIVLCFRTTILGRPEEGSVVITDTKVISRSYTQWPYLHHGHFVYDLLAVIPIDLGAIAASGGILGMTGCWLRVNRLLHALRIINVHGGQIQRQTRMKKLCVYGILWLFLSHNTACCWWAIGVSEFNIKAAAARSTQIWPMRIKGQAVYTSSSLAQQYLSSFYWAVTVLVKVPWVAPHTWQEQAFTAVIIMIGTLTFSVIIGQVTMQIKALDMARQARSERLSRMRMFCRSRKVPIPMEKNVLQWVFADQDFSSKYIGRAQLKSLPGAMRSPLVQKMYENILDTFPFKKGGVSAPAINMILLKLNPLVLLRGMIVIEPGVASTTLYVLQKGCLRIALPKEKDDGKGANSKSSRMRSARVSTSPVRGVKGGGLGLKSTKEFAKFRVLERPGQTVGIADIDNLHTIYPFHVDCTAMAYLFLIESGGLKEALTAMAHEDEEKARSVLKKEHQIHVDGLKINKKKEEAADESTTAESSVKEASKVKIDAPENPNATDGAAAEPAGHEELVTTTGTAVASLSSASKTAFKELRDTHKNTNQLRSLVETLGGDVQLAMKKGSGRRNTTSPGGDERRHSLNSHREDTDELEERTGFTAANSRSSIASSARAAFG